ncbi:MAG: DUF5335 family protein [Nitrospirales bacterium]|nr:DUF5335 family protein [Nitrospirales bacterium]
MSSRILDIPPDEWGGFFDELTREHRNAIVTIDVNASEIEDRIHVQDVPLEGIALLLNGNEEVISIIVRKGAREHTMHSIHDPHRVRYEKAGGMATRLQVESENGETTIVTFRSMSVPDTVQAQTMSDPA